MGTKNIEDLNLLLAKRSLGSSNPAVLYVDNTTGALSAALTKGTKYIIKASSQVYFKRCAAASVPATVVLVTEGTTPSTSNPLFAGESVVLIIDHDATDNYIAFRCATGLTALVWIIPCGDLSRQ